MLPGWRATTRAPDVLRRKSFSRLRGQSYALRLALFVFCFSVFSVSPWLDSFSHHGGTENTEKNKSNARESDHHEIRRHVRRRRECLSQRSGDCERRRSFAAGGRGLCHWWI